MAIRKKQEPSEYQKALCKFQFGIVNSVKSENYLYTGI